MAVIHGRNVKIYNSSGTALIGAAKSCVVNMDADNFEVASETSATILVGVAHTDNLLFHTLCF